MCTEFRRHGQKIVENDRKFLEPINTSNKNICFLIVQFFLIFPTKLGAQICFPSTALRLQLDADRGGRGNDDEDAD